MASRVHESTCTITKSMSCRPIHHCDHDKTACAIPLSLILDAYNHNPTLTSWVVQCILKIGSALTESEEHRRGKQV